MLTSNVENMSVTSIGRTLETSVVPTQYIMIISTVRRQSEVSIQRWIDVGPIVNFCFGCNFNSKQFFFAIKIFFPTRLVKIVLSPSVLRGENG